MKKVLAILLLCFPLVSAGGFDWITGNLLGNIGNAFSVCPAPYHIWDQKTEQCQWSCAYGTVPDQSTYRCKCKSGYVSVGTDQFNRIVCNNRLTLKKQKNPPTCTELAKSCIGRDCNYCSASSQCNDGNLCTKDYCNNCVCTHNLVECPQSNDSCYSNKCYPDKGCMSDYICNRPLVITGVSGPDKLQANSSGNWTMTAVDPEGGRLMYAVDWGDDSDIDSNENRSVLSGQASTFAHSYSTPGRYELTFTANDENSSYAKTLRIVDVYIPCSPLWTCSDWSECDSKGIAHRDCKTQPGCEGLENKPETSHRCGCTNASECTAFFSSCTCSWICTSVVPLENCDRECSVNRTSPPDCGCKSGDCFPAELRFEREPYVKTRQGYVEIAWSIQGNPKTIFSYGMTRKYESGSFSVLNSVELGYNYKYKVKPSTDYYYRLDVRNMTFESMFKTEPDYCAGIVSPVCGTDGKTYDNKCIARDSLVDIECERECPCNPECTDEDNGNHFKKGVTKGMYPGSSAYVKVEDACDGNRLIEYTCGYQNDPTGYGYITKENVMCKIGCVDGRCITHKCPDGVCEKGETVDNCQADCTKAVCGNSICEEGEADYCPPCTKIEPACKAPCIAGKCPRDCEKPECATERDCDDNRECTIDSCEDGQCRHDENQCLECQTDGNSCIDERGIYMDGCQGQNVVEYACEENYCRVMDTSYCQYGCVNGKCISQNTCEGCYVDEKCYPIGYRRGRMYCDNTGKFLRMGGVMKKCENNFQCSTNLCIANRCVEQDVVDRFLMFFRRFMKGN